MAENVVTVIDLCLRDSTLYKTHTASLAIRNTRNWTIKGDVQLLKNNGKKLTCGNRSINIKLKLILKNIHQNTFCDNFDFCAV